jgi:predicted nucleotidyltransferase
VVILGSAVTDLADEFSDLDVFVYVDMSSYEEVYKWYKASINDGTVNALNVSALRYHEFPMIHLQDLHGHYKVETYQDVEARIRSYEDAYLWSYSLGKSLHDPQDRYAELKRRAAYPQDVLHQRLRKHYLEAWNGLSAMKNPLIRNQPETVKLIVSEGLLHVLKMCCLTEKKPFPHTKWLLESALSTELGKRIKPHLEKMMSLMAKPITIEMDLPLVKPGHRNEEFEKYAIFRNWLLLKREMDLRLEDYGLGGKE